MSKGLTALKTKIETGIADLSSLEVASFAGSSSDLKLADITADAKNSKQKKVFKAIEEALTKGTLVGYSKFEVDGDTLNFINDTLGEDKKYLVEGHAALVEGAQKSRKDFFDFVIKVLGAKTNN